jgi:hypothetical protein
MSEVHCEPCWGPGWDRQEKLLSVLPVALRDGAFGSEEGGDPFLEWCHNPGGGPTCVLPNWDSRSDSRLISVPGSPLLARDRAGGTTPLCTSACTDHDLGHMMYHWV